VGRTHQVEVLAAGLADDARVRAQGVKVLRDVAPELLEDGGRAGEVERGEVRVGKGQAADEVGVAGDELDDARREAGLLEDLVDEVAGEDGHGRGLPDDDVAEHGGRGGQVAGDGLRGRSSFAATGGASKRAVKLKGLHAKTKPSSGRYSTRLGVA
jgi:hypothetical protein